MSAVQALFERSNPGAPKSAPFCSRWRCADRIKARSHPVFRSGTQSDHASLRSQRSIIITTSNSTAEERATPSIGRCSTADHRRFRPPQPARDSPSCEAVNALLRLLPRTGQRDINENLLSRTEITRGTKKRSRKLAAETRAIVQSFNPTPDRRLGKRPNTQKYRSF